MEVGHVLRSFFGLPEYDGADAPENAEGGEGDKEGPPPLELRGGALDGAHGFEAVLFFAEEDEFGFAAARGRVQRCDFAELMAHCASDGTRSYGSTYRPSD